MLNIKNIKSLFSFLWKTYRHFIYLIIVVAVLLHLPFGLAIFSNAIFDSIFAIVCGYVCSTMLFKLANPHGEHYRKRN